MDSPNLAGATPERHGPANAIGCLVLVGCLPLALVAIIVGNTLLSCGSTCTPSGGLSSRSFMILLVGVGMLAGAFLPFRWRWSTTWVPVPLPVEFAGRGCLLTIGFVLIGGFLMMVWEAMGQSLVGPTVALTALTVVACAGGLAVGLRRTRWSQAGEMALGLAMMVGAVVICTFTIAANIVALRGR